MDNDNNDNVLFFYSASNVNISVRFTQGTKLIVKRKKFIKVRNLRIKIVNVLGECQYR